MGRFSDKLSAKGISLQVGGLVAYVVDNSNWNTNTHGIRYRSSPVLQDLAPATKEKRHMGLSNEHKEDACSIQEGTRLIVLCEADMFENVSSSSRARSLKKGCMVEAAGRASHYEGFDMVPIRLVDGFEKNDFPPTGAIQLALVELESEYYMYHEPLARFGDTVRGIPTDDGWLKVRSMYLPLQCKGHDVLIPAASIAEEGAEDDSQGALASAHAAAADDEDEEEEVVDALRGLQGTGTPYAIVHDRVVGRLKPHSEGKIMAIKRNGQTVELFEFDQTRKWRAGFNESTAVMVWWLIDHPELGPLLRPKDQPYSVKPMEPLCVAAKEDLIQDLQRFLDEGSNVDIYDAAGHTPLMLAAKHDNLECCVLLVEAGANPMARVSPPELCNKTAMEMASSERTQALLKALCGLELTNYADFDRAFAKLRSDFQEIVSELRKRPPLRNEDLQVRKEEAPSAGYQGDDVPLLQPKLAGQSSEPIFVAVRENSIDDLRQLIAEGCDVAMGDALGRTPLMVAADKGNLECCLLLIEAGSDPNTAVSMTSSKQHAAVFKALCGDEDFDVIDYEAAVSGLQPEYQEILLDLKERCDS